MTVNSLSDWIEDPLKSVKTTKSEEHLAELIHRREDLEKVLQRVNSSLFKVTL